MTQTCTTARRHLPTDFFAAIFALTLSLVSSSMAIAQDLPVNSGEKIAFLGDSITLYSQIEDLGGVETHHLW